MWGSSAVTRLAVTAEIRSASNQQEAECAGRDAIELEVVCVDALGNDVLIQAALNPGVATFYTHLLLGKSFGEMLDYFSSLRRGHWPASIPIGVCRASKVFVNPSDEKLGRL